MALGFHYYRRRLARLRLARLGAAALGALVLTALLIAAGRMRPDSWGPLRPSNTDRETTASTRLPAG